MTVEIFKAEGFEELEQQLIELANNFRADTAVRGAVNKAVAKALEPVLASAIADAPRDEKNTGPIHLQDTIRSNVRIPTSADRKSEFVSPTDFFIGVVSVKKSAVSLSQEFGNARTPQHPFLRTALERNRDNVINILKSELAVSIPAQAQKLAKRKI
jgi:HK97 gp10 family phage protein